jgi:(1->4)-alpha-D-glucan 1-alpha-D-glucosylmutase
MPLNDSDHVPLSTYRIQLHGKSTFADQGALIGYFRALGISDLYLSPIFTSVPGSLHGYDVTDYSEINPELGGAEGFQRLAQQAREADCRIILDFVPNHMGIAGMLNEWWRDVLENGPFSGHAPFFDIQWKTEPGEDHPRLLVPILHDHYGRVLEQGEIKLVFETGFSVRYRDTVLPLRPESYSDLLGMLADPPEAAAVAALAREFAGCATPERQEPTGGDQRVQALTDLKARLGRLLDGAPNLRRRLTELLAGLNGEVGDARSFDALHRIVERQHYRVARWQAGAHEINYRRFFAIDTLVGLHMENPEVFRECHALVGRLLASGDVAGLRIDHIDGLRQPEDYLRRIQTLHRSEQAKPLYVLVEKIVAEGEGLPEAWPVHGTTGYEFITQLSGVLVDAAEEGRFDRIYRRATGEWRPYAELVYRSKRMIIAEMFANAVSNLGAELVQIVAADRLWRDLTRHELTTAVSELIAHLPVYRTYRRRKQPVSEPDRRVLETACAQAIGDNPRADPQPLEFLRDLLTGTYPPAGAAEGYRTMIMGWVLTFQQYTGAIMAKSVEDTVFYTYNRFIALNEVGGNPGTFGSTLEAFHRANAVRAAETPLALLTTSTHDSKLSEDVRARLYALSELGAEWEAWVMEWERVAAPFTTPAEEGPAPDNLDRYRFFQILLGAWPLAAGEVDDSFRDRLRKYFRKAVNEAKRHTSILNNNEAYLVACDGFVDRLLEAGANPGFRVSFEAAAGRVARLGMVNALTQLVLKCTVPGVPDFYQGNEIWDFSLVDPDNRRPVDFDLRKALLERVGQLSFPTLLEEWRDGGIKLRVTQVLLLLRRAHPALFAKGGYEAVSAAGSFAPHVISFRRQHGEVALLVVVPRLSAKIGAPPVGSVWDDTRIEGLEGPGEWNDVFTGKLFPSGGPIFLRSLLAELPFAVLTGRNPEPPRI